MPFYFRLQSMPGAVCYMGRDKEENDLLIRWGWPEDVWFHVDKHSSAHVYVRLQKGEDLSVLSDDAIAELCQLVKHNSIEGSKLNNVKINYTMWSNLRKSGDMDAGQVGYHKSGDVRHTTVAKKEAKILNPLEKTREWRDVDLRKEREDRDAEERALEQKLKADQRAREKAEKEAAEKAAKERSYDGWGKGMETSNQDAGDLEDDFM
eukprot:TRINITY_DN35599_c0_g1_i1.p1 TRINITY_DN35599_c0_g1~~TRINITY_DN35599_c0_g1_i1.p1  ORF type:complete len:238 (+),score=88.94 TRINITY_DN35599_c0_g1_i1:96-716(+)